MGVSKSKLTYSEWVKHFSLNDKVTIKIERDRATKMWSSALQTGEELDSKQIEEDIEAAANDDLELEEDIKPTTRPEKGGHHTRMSTLSSSMMAQLRKSATMSALGVSAPDAEMSTLEGKFTPLYQRLCDVYCEQILQEHEPAIQKALQSQKSKHADETWEKYRGYFKEAINNVLYDPSAQAKFLRACRSTKDVVRKVEFIEVASTGGIMKPDGVYWALFNVYRPQLDDESTAFGGRQSTIDTVSGLSERKSPSIQPTKPQNALDRVSVMGLGQPNLTRHVSSPSKVDSKAGLVKDDSVPSDV